MMQLMMRMVMHLKKEVLIMSRGLKRFFGVCAVLVVLGLILVIVGYVTGGVHYMDRLDSKFSWLSIGEGDMEYMQLDEPADFDSIDITGDVDVFICSGSEAGARLHFDRNATEPVLKVENGTLKAEASMKKGAVISFDWGDRAPYVEIYVPEGKTLKDIHIDTECGDITLRGISAGSIDLRQELGDTDLENVSCDSLTAESECGDIEGSNIKSKATDISSELGDVDLQGEFTGNTTVKAESGSVEIDTALSEMLYTVQADVEAGELEIGGKEHGSFENHVVLGNGANILKVVCSLGDVDINFAEHHDD